LGARRCWSLNAKGAYQTCVLRLGEVVSEFPAASAPARRGEAVSAGGAAAAAAAAGAYARWKRPAGAEMAPIIEVVWGDATPQEKLLLVCAHKQGIFHTASSVPAECTGCRLSKWGSSPPPPSRTKWTRRVPHPVLIGHVTGQVGKQLEGGGRGGAAPPYPPHEKNCVCSMPSKRACQPSHYSRGRDRGNSREGGVRCLQAHVPVQAPLGHAVGGTVGRGGGGRCLRSARASLPAPSRPGRPASRRAPCGETCPLSTGEGTRTLTDSGHATTGRPP